jgi:AAA15 family ATPase/GTPase
MIQEITIENYKSIQSLSIELGRVTVFIGENGCGKSNILEAIALGSAAAADNDNNDRLLSIRGIRSTEPRLMRSGFDIQNLSKNIQISFKFNTYTKFLFSLIHDNNLYSKWQSERELPEELFHQVQVETILSKAISHPNTKVTDEDLKQWIIESDKNTYTQLQSIYRQSDYYKWMINFYIFCPQIIGLRNFEQDENNLPLGVNGEGLFKYIKYLSLKESQKELIEIKEKLELIDWFEDFEIPDNLYPGERALKIKDRYLDPDLEYFDQKSANEGFLFLLFYFCLFIGEETPKFFAIDNIDSSLNPLLCRRLIEEIVELAKKHDKQVILTTHNPAALDGLDLHDEEQKLYVISRKLSGHTRADQVFPPKAPEGKKPVRLSEAFLRGYIGGLPENF